MFDKLYLFWQQYSKILEYNKIQRFVNFCTFLCSLGIHFSVKKTCNVLYKFSVVHSHFNLIKVFYFYSPHWVATSYIDPNMTLLIDLGLFSVWGILIRDRKYNYKFTYLYISLDCLVFLIAEVLVLV